ncbi:MAG: bacteriohemerythrin [Gammaproteobacteria bacterium]|nr:MAG: bacteriohemerythrin [Gammaproteobacteria bacterium]
MHIVWTPNYQIGIEVIDNQHRRIVEYINEVYAVREKQEPRGRLAEVLFDLVDYTMSHFAFEEALMDEAGYPDIALHRLTHDTFTRQIQTFKKRFEGGEDIAEDLANMLQRWLLEHIVTDDVSYSEVVKRQIVHPAHDHHNWVKKAIDKFFAS